MSQMSPAPFRIKICGVRSVDDARHVLDSGADAIGLNFYAQSPRFVDERQARQIVEALDGRLKVVGVFVNHDAETILGRVDSLGLDLVQLHGDEPVELLQAVGAERVIRAVRCRRRDFQRVHEVLAELQQLNPPPTAALLDAYSPTSYGGTGRRLDWPSVARLSRRLPIVLSGGLNPANVADAIEMAQPSAVDTASGVESSAGIKDRSAIDAFVRAAWSAFAKA